VGGGFIGPTPLTSPLWCAVWQLEGAFATKYGKLVSFSEQELIDCDSGQEGCEGGIYQAAFTFVGKNGGLCTEGEGPDGRWMVGLCCNFAYTPSPVKRRSVVAGDHLSLNPRVVVPPEAYPYEHHESGSCSTTCTPVPGSAVQCWNSVASG
jgi:hypothetical protein